jgi:cysteine dioxygenase
MAHPLRTSVEDLIEGLKSFERDYITADSISKFMDAHRLGVDELRKYTFFREDYYTRNLIFRDDKFEVMCICWKPGQRTVIHSHNGALGWMILPQGEVAVHDYKYVTCDHPERQNVVGIDCLAGGHEIQLDRTGSVHVLDGSPIYQVDKLHTIHQIENVDKSNVGVVSLHIYSPPIDSCVSYDLEKHRCSRKTLKYYSRYGEVEVEAETTPDGKLKVIH